MGKWQNAQKFNRKFVLLPTQQKNGSCAMHRSRVLFTCAAATDDKRLLGKKFFLFRNGLRILCLLDIGGKLRYKTLHSALVCI